MSCNQWFYTDEGILMRRIIALRTNWSSTIKSRPSRSTMAYIWRRTVSVIGTSISPLHYSAFFDHSDLAINFKRPGRHVPYFLGKETLPRPTRGIRTIPHDGRISMIRRGAVLLILILKIRDGIFSKFNHCTIFRLFFTTRMGSIHRSPCNIDLSHGTFLLLAIKFICRYTPLLDLARNVEIPRPRSIRRMQVC